MIAFTISCSFGGAPGTITIYIGQCESNHHPLHFQQEWLSKERGGAIPDKVMKSLADLKKIADTNNVSFEKLCEYALRAAAIEDTNTEASSPAPQSAPAADQPNATTTQPTEPTQ